MLRTFFLIVFFFCFFSVQAQLVDDFADGNFSESPTWFGDDSLWQINAALQLQSKGTTGTTKDVSLVAQNTELSNTEWRFWIRFNLSPSTQNFCRFYLASDQTNLKGNLNGYYIQFGGSTGNTDTISLYKQEGSKRTRIIAGRPATIAKSNNILNIKVNRDLAGNWFLYSDTSAVGNFQLEGSVVDTTFRTTDYSGFFARFTSGNITNFYLDDVYIGAPIIDITPPQIQTFEILNDSIIKLNFSETVNSNVASKLQNYELDNIFPQLISAQVNQDLKSVLLFFEGSFISTTNYKLLIKNIEDAVGNKMNDSTLNFTFYKPTVADVVINEIMPDPSPSNGLPDAEFIELFNRTNYPINIGGWKITDNSSSAILPSYTIQPLEYLIIANPTSEPLFKNYGKTLAVPFLPGLNNDGDWVQILDEKNRVIDKIDYDLSWYNSSVKSGGGWSLELINPYTLCKGVDNWLASESPVGGTPGKANFFSSNQPDLTAPQVKNWFYTDSLNAVIVFNEKMDSAAMQGLVLTVNGNPVSSKTIKGSKFDSVYFTFTQPLVYNQNYTLQVDSAFDCSLNKINNNTVVSFTYIPIEPAKQNDIIITEISANPIAGVSLPNAEYIELYNRSKHIILLNNFKIKSGSSVATIGNIRLYPDSFIAICDDSKLPAFAAYKNVLAVTSFPSLSTDDEVVLLNENNLIIHQVGYKNSWYNNPVKANGGWSLEMIDTKNPCGLASNWSASKNAIGGTIGFKNSVAGNNLDTEKPQLTRVYPNDANHVVLYFNKTLDSNSICKQNSLNFSPPINGNFTFSFNDDFLTELQISFTDSIKANTVYNIKIDSAQDCASNTIEVKNELEFGLCKPADSNDIVINEILFNPRPNGVDFVEIYNKTNDYIDVKNLWIGNRNEAAQIDNFYALAPNGYMLLPKSYYAITTNAEILKSQHTVFYPKNIIEINSLPSFSDDEGTCVLFAKPELVYDELAYNEKMHFTLIDNKEGVSLERIDFNKSTNDKNNWTSAASTSGFATPTYKNSQYLNFEIKNQTLSIEPEVFTPNNDGTNDLVTFTYKFEKNNYTGTLQIFNSSGVLVKTLLNNLPLGTEGSLTWNGLSEKNSALPVGIYVVYFTYFNTDGSSNAIKKTLVIGKTF